MRSNKVCYGVSAVIHNLHTEYSFWFLLHKWIQFMMILRTIEIINAHYDTM